METATAARIGAGYPGIAENKGMLPGGREHARSKGMAEQCLDGTFLPDRDTLVSFLVNALYLFGDQGVAAYGGLPEGVEAELSRLGHKVSHGSYLGRGGKDRALFLAQTFGRGGDDDIMEALRAMRKAVRPGGLICFHIFDRDRAWSLVGERILSDESGPAKVRLGFQPETGRLTARVSVQGARTLTGSASGGHGAGGQASVKTWNLGEIRSLLRSAGLHLERAYDGWEGGWDGGGPDSEAAASGRLIIVAARPRVARNRNARVRAGDGGAGEAGKGREGTTA